MSASKFCINVQGFINIVEPRGGSDAALVLSTGNAASIECLSHETEIVINVTSIF